MQAWGVSVKNKTYIVETVSDGSKKSKGKYVILDSYIVIALHSLVYYATDHSL